MINIFRTIAALGVILLSIGIISKKRVKQNLFYIFGGLFLEIYSIFIGDYIFMLLQLIFVFAAVYDLYKLKFLKK
jgi:lipid-A-disaccharide synthase-like uncharacterized protein